MPLSNTPTSLPPWHHFPLDLTAFAVEAKIGMVLSKLHEPPVSSGSLNLKERQVKWKENKTQQPKHSSRQG